MFTFKKKTSIKKIIIGESGIGKSKECFQLANKYKGTVVYFSGVAKSENFYQNNEEFRNFIVADKNRNIHLENGKKYFFSPENATKCRLLIEDITMLFAEKNVNDFTGELTNNILVIIDDDYWRFQKNVYRNLLLMGMAENDVIITAQSLHDLFDERIPEQKIIQLCNRCGWEVCIMRNN